MSQIILAFALGPIPSGAFSFLKFPAFTTATFAVVGFFGLFCGYLVMSNFFN